MSEFVLPGSLRLARISSFVMTLPSERTAARVIAFCSSRILPFHVCSCSDDKASTPSFFHSDLGRNALLKSSRNLMDRALMSSMLFLGSVSALRCSREGILIRMVSMR